MPFRIAIRPDALEVLAYADPGPQLDAGALDDALARAGVVSGVDKAACEALVTRGPEPPVVVARGVAPQQGRDGRLEVHVRDERSAVGTGADDGRIDFHDRGAFTRVERGQHLATVHPPQPGRPGLDVLGRSLVARSGRPVPLRLGAGVRVDRHDGRLYASLDGDLRIAADRIEVVARIEIEGNLDHTLGDMDCSSHVHVKGDVMPGFRVKTRGDVWVDGAVESAEIDCGGDLVVRQGVFACSRLLVGQSARLGHVYDSTVICRGTVEVGKEVVRSTVVAGGRVSVRGRGIVVGSRVLARGAVDVGQVRSVAGAGAVVGSGIDPHEELEHMRDEAAERFRRAPQPATSPERVELVAIRIRDCAREGVTLRVEEEETLLRAEARAGIYGLDAESGEIAPQKGKSAA